MLSGLLHFLNMSQKLVDKGNPKEFCYIIKNFNLMLPAQNDGECGDLLKLCHVDF